MESNHHRCYTDSFSRGAQQTNVCLSSNALNFIPQTGLGLRFEVAEPLTLQLLFCKQRSAAIHHRPHNPPDQKRCAGVTQPQTLNYFFFLKITP